MLFERNGLNMQHFLFVAGALDAPDQLSSSPLPNTAARRIAPNVPQHNPEDASPELRPRYLEPGSTNRAWNCHAQVLMDCSKAIDLCPGWSKPYFRMGTAHLAFGSWDAAMQACRTGESLLGFKVRSWIEHLVSLRSINCHDPLTTHGSRLQTVTCHEGPS